MPNDSYLESDLWKLKFEDILSKFETRLSGLNNNEVQERSKLHGLNAINKNRLKILPIILRQLTGNPLIIVLIFATLVSFFLGERTTSLYIFGIIVVSLILGFWNEFAAEKTVQALLGTISRTALVIRNGEKLEVPVEHLTLGDVVILNQGTIVPADLRLIETKNLQINQSVLTGESKTSFKTNLPMEEQPKSIGEIANFAYMGTSVDFGIGKGVVINIGKNTEFGKIAKTTLFSKPETDFEKGLTEFGRLLLKITLILTLGIFVLNSLFGHSILDSLIFALAIAVGLTPELLPVIVTVSLSHGAGKLAKKKIVIKQLIAIENLGNMDILCTDKTGTLTEGNIELFEFFDLSHQKNPLILQMGLMCNDAVIHHKILGNGIDSAIWNFANKNSIRLEENIIKICDVPFDYDHKAMFSVIRKNDRLMLIAKGAPQAILDRCANKTDHKQWQEKFSSLNQEGLRVVAVASKEINTQESYSWNDVADLKLDGYMTFLDVPRPSAKQALQRLSDLNVAVKVITGDNEIVTQKVCQEVGMEISGIMLGSQIDELDDLQLAKEILQINVFARVTPEQKMRIIQAFKRNGHVVGYLGDGVNDIPPLRNADVGISVNNGVDVAKDSASIVLLSKSLDVIADGIIEGRKTFNNTIKYILMSTSSNFGNMFSAAGASLFLPFLPMKPVQILLTNALYDISQLSIPGDNVDKESLIKPKHWDIRFIRNYMIFFGPISSAYDFLTFGIMYFMFKARGPLFQTGWFIESMATEILVVFAIRTSKSPFFKSRPGKWLLITCLSIVGVAVLLPYSPLASHLGFVPLPPQYFVVLIILVSTYLLIVEIVKRKFLKTHHL